MIAEFSETKLGCDFVSKTEGYKRKKKHTMTTYSVIVIGAGVSGLYAVRRLER